jgi:ATP-dependent DNA helicase RecQ
VLTPLGARAMRSEVAIRMRVPRSRAPRAGATKKRRAPAAERTDVEAAPGDATLFEALRVHRATVAGEAGVPAYVVAHDRTLAEIAARRPTRAEELGEIRGMGPVKIARYGEGFLAIVRRFTES